MILTSKYKFYSYFHFPLKQHAIESIKNAFFCNIASFFQNLPSYNIRENIRISNLSCRPGNGFSTKNEKAIPLYSMGAKMKKARKNGLWTLLAYLNPLFHDVTKTRITKEGRPRKGCQSEPGKGRKS